MQIGSYSILSGLGEGGMGKVYLAEHIHTGRKVVLKSLLPQYAQNEMARKRFYQEGKLLAQLSHPAIVQLYDFFVHEETPYLVMEYVQGEPLDALLERIGKPLAWEWIWRKMTPILGALAYVHSQDIIHRDLKPSNIMVIPKAGAKLLDFGIAKAMDGDLRLTQTGSQVGTVLYMAPEQIRGEPVSPRTDLYAMGLILYQCAFGRYPWKYEGKTQFELYQTLLTEPPPIPKWATSAERRFFERALAKDPTDRFASAEEMLEALRQVATAPAEAPDPTTSNPETPPERAVVSTIPPIEPVPAKETAKPHPSPERKSTPNPAPAPQTQTQEEPATEKSKSSGCGLWTFLVAAVLAYPLSRVLFVPFGSLSAVLVIASLGGFWLGSILSGQARTIAFSLGGVAVALLLHLHFIAWPIIKGRFESSQKVYAYLRDKLEEYEKKFEESRKKYDTDLILSELEPPAEIRPELLNRKKNLAFRPSLQILFLRNPDLSRGDKGRFYRPKDTLLLNCVVFYEEAERTLWTSRSWERCPEYGYDWWRPVLRRKYLISSCEQKEVLRIFYQYSDNPNKRSFPEPKRTIYGRKCSLLREEWRTEDRGECEWD